jgi:hypothetical protein
MQTITSKNLNRVHNQFRRDIRDILPEGFELISASTVTQDAADKTKENLFCCTIEKEILIRGEKKTQKINCYGDTFSEVVSSFISQL